MPYIGIDFGTSNSVVANFQFGQAEVVPNHEGQKWTPSIVTMRRYRSRAFAQAAEEQFLEHSSTGIGKLGVHAIHAVLGKHLGERFQEKTGFAILNSPYKQQFMLGVEKAKIELSAEQTAVARKAELVPERHLSLEEDIDRGQFERLTMPLIHKSGTALNEALRLRGVRAKAVGKVR